MAKLKPPPAPLLAIRFFGRNEAANRSYLPNIYEKPPGQGASPHPLEKAFWDDDDVTRHNVHVGLGIAVLQQIPDTQAIFLLHTAFRPDKGGSVARGEFRQSAH